MFVNHGFTNMGQRMRRWLHCKYHFMWDDPCTVSLGVGVVFYLSFLLAFIFSSFFGCFISFLFFSYSLRIRISFSFFLLFLFFFLVFIRRIVLCGPCATLETSLGKVQEDLYNYSHLVICCPLSHEDHVTFSPWYINGKYVLFEVNLVESMTPACKLVSPTLVNCFWANPCQLSQVE